MQWIVRSFLRGLLFTVPVGATLYVLWWLFVVLDNLLDAERWIGFDLPGIGVVLVLVLVTAVGFLASSFLTAWLLRLFETLLQRAPLAKLVYSSIRDLLDAFVGEKRRFDVPVAVRLGALDAEAIGFITGKDLAWLGREGSVAVYFPQSYNFAGNLLLFPSSAVTPLEADSAAVMQFVVSGGISGRS